MAIEPAGATVCMREARLAVCPIGVYSTFPPASTVRTDYFARVDANASFERRPSLGGEMMPVFAQLLAQLEGGIEGALRMVLVGGRGAEQRKDAVVSGLH
jgi:hypothetical protein